MKFCQNSLLVSIQGHFVSIHIVQYRYRVQCIDTCWIFVHCINTGFKVSIHTLSFSKNSWKICNLAFQNPWFHILMQTFDFKHLKLIWMIKVWIRSTFKIKSERIGTFGHMGKAICNKRIFIQTTYAQVFFFLKKYVNIFLICFCHKSLT